jgi:hypothetical protein
MPEMTTHSPGLASVSLTPLVSGDAGAHDRRHVDEIGALRNAADISGAREHILGKAAIDAVAGVVLFAAQGLPASGAIFAAAAGIVQPRHANDIAFAKTERAAATRTLANGGDVCLPLRDRE